METDTKNNKEMEKHEASEQALERLQEQLHSSNASVRRRAAFNLSWMQEDGLQILRDILLGDFPETTKNAAAYGLRKMQGRMKKMALDVFKEGLRQRNNTTGQISRNALVLLGYKIPQEYLPDKKVDNKTKIKDFSGKTRPRRPIGKP